MMRPNRWVLTVLAWLWRLLTWPQPQRHHLPLNDASSPVPVPAPLFQEHSPPEEGTSVAPNWVRIRSQEMEAFSRGSWLVAMELVSHGSGAFKMHGSQFQVMKISKHRCSSGLHTFLLLHVSTRATVRVCWLKRTEDETEEQDVLVATLFCREDQLVVVSLLEACRLYEIDMYPLEGISC